MQQPVNLPAELRKVAGFRSDSEALLMALAADEIEKLRLMAYEPHDKHEPKCDCIQCMPF